MVFIAIALGIIFGSPISTVVVTTPAVFDSTFSTAFN